MGREERGFNKVGLEGGVDEPPDTSSIDFKSLVSGDEEILFTFESDLREDHTFGSRWLVLTNKRIIVYTPSTGNIQAIPLKNVKDVRFFDYLGSGEIEVELITGKVVSLIHFTRSRVEEFRRAWRLIEELGVEGEEYRKIERECRTGENGFSNKVAKRDVLLRLLVFLKSYWYLGVLTIFLSLMSVALGLIPPYLLKILIDEAIDGGNIGLLEQLVMYLIAVYFASTLVNIIRNYALAYLGEKIIFDMRVRLYDHIQRLSLRFHDKYGSGRLISRISDDTSRIRWFLTWGVQSFIISILQIVGIGVVVFTMDPFLSLFALIPIPFVFYGVYYFRRKARRVYHRAWRRWADVGSLLVDTIPGILVVKAFSQEKREISKFKALLSEVIKANLETVKLRLEVFPLLGLITSVSAVLVWWMGGLSVISGDLKLGTLIAFVSYMWQFYGPVNTLSSLVEPLQTALTAGERIFEILENKLEESSSEETIDFKFKGHIRFENVYFGYEPYVYVLHGINLEIKPGEVVGVVGPSGSGKTTLIKLLLRLYNPDKGRILIDGVDLRKIKLESLRKQIGIVLQEPILFSGTVAENIAYGKSRIQPEEIIAVAKAAYAHNFIMKFPTAYDTDVGERGNRLSGGERQRIAIARAILTDPKILILDEATSSVDTITERQIQAALNNLVKGRTTIVIAHRLSTVKNADKIIVMNKGQIVEMGTHRELLERNGLYRRLWDAQFEEEKRRKSEKIQLV